MASPLSENSHWVNKELEYWLENKSIDTILIALTGGMMEWDKQNNCFLNPDNNSLPPILDDKFTDEPFYIDLRQSKTEADLSLDNPIFKKEILKLAAKLHGKAPNDLASEEVTVHRKMLYLRNSVIAVLIVLLGLSILKTNEANKQTIEAERQTQIARDSSASAQEQRELAFIQTKIAEDREEEARKQTQIARDSSISAQKQREIALIQTKIARDSSISAQKQREIVVVALEKALKSDSTAKVERDKAVIEAIISKALVLNSTAKDLLAKGWNSEALRVCQFAYKTALKANIPVPDQIQSLLIQAFSNDGPWQLLKIDHSKTLASDLSQDGKFILTGSEDKTAILWDITGEKLRAFKKDTTRVISVAFSPDGKSILIGTEDSASLWKTNGTKIRTFDYGDRDVLSLGFSPDGKIIFIENTFWNSQGEKIKILDNRRRDPFTIVAFPSHGKLIITGGYWSNISIWDSLGKKSQSFQAPADFGQVRSLAISHNGKYILAGFHYSNAILWNNEGKILETFNDFTNSVTSTAFSPDGESFYLSDSYTFNIFNVLGEKLNSLPIRNLGSYFTSNNAKFTPDGNSILITYDEGPILYDLQGIQNIIWNKIIPREIFIPSLKESYLYEPFNRFEKAVEISGSFVRERYLVPLYYASEIYSYLESPECTLRQLTREEKVRYGIIEERD